MSNYTIEEAEAVLAGRGFIKSSTSSDKSYWARTDGQPEIFLDHSATLTFVGTGKGLVSDFVNSNAGAL